MIQLHHNQKIKIAGTTGLVKKKTDYNTKITEIEGKIPDINNLVTKTALTIVENKIPDISNLATKTALTSVENKIPNVSSLVKKTDYNTRVAEIDTKLSNLDGKITKNENEITKNTSNTLLFFLANKMFDGNDGYQAYLTF